MNLTSRSATELLSLLAARQVAAEEVVEAHIRAIEGRDGDINAVAIRRFDRALDEAAVIDGRRARGHQPGPLAGPPPPEKVCFPLVGTPTTSGGAPPGRQPPPGAAPAIAAALNARACGNGQTNSPPRR